MSRATVVAALAALTLAGCSASRGKTDSPANPGGFLVGDGQSLLPVHEGEPYFTPVKAPTPELLARLKLPDGFRADVWATGLGRARMMALGPDGTVYLTRPDAGQVVALRDGDGDWKAAPPVTVVTLPRVHGISIHEGKRMYLATVGEAYVCELAGGKVGPPRRIVEGMPTEGGHHNRTLAVGPDGRLYITVGSTCNSCWEKNAENATMLVANADGTGRRIFARGLRNTIGFAWHPATAQLWGMDHGIDWLGADTPPEELNRLEEGRHYGWPFVFGDRRTIPLATHPAVGPLKEFAARTTPPALAYQAHSSPIAMVFYTGTQFPPEYRGDAFVAFHGSWNRSKPTGYKVVRIRFQEGKPVGFEDFLTGFLVEDPSGPYAFGRPAGLLVTADGSLLVTDDTNGVIYRVSRNTPPVPPKGSGHVSDRVSSRSTG